MNYAIHKAAGIIIKDKKLLVEKSIGKDFYNSPGGSIEEGETAKQALVRELLEEFSITVDEAGIEAFDTFYAEAANHPGKVVRMDTFIVNKWQGEPTPTSEVEVLKWITSDYGDLPLGSIFANDVIPRLASAGLIP